MRRGEEGEKGGMGGVTSDGETQKKKVSEKV